ncbi:MAG: chromosomal replication initiator protein DnaA [Eggerthellaceae bacterium]
MDLEKLWTDLIQQLKSYPNVNTSQIDAFFSRVQIQAASPGFIMFTSDNSFIKDWIEKHYTKDIQQALKDLYDIDFFIQIEVDPTFAPASATPAPAAPAVPAPTQGQPINDQSNQVIASHMQTDQHEALRSHPNASYLHASHEDPSSQMRTPYQEYSEKIAQLQARSRSEEDQRREYHTPYSTENKEASALNAADNSLEGDPSSGPMPVHKESNSLTFDTFVIGDSNRMAYSMAVEVADRPGSSALNPLFIYGRSGVGKTHLLCAIQNYINEQYQDFNVCYIDSMELVNKYSDAAIEKSVDKQSFKNFENFFQKADVLLIDDIQGLQGKPGTLSALFRIFNSMIAKGKQFVFAADRAPKNIDIDERYVSRFNSGATIDIQPPDDETKQSIIKSFIKQYQQEEGLSFTISDDILDYIVENSSSNIRELKSAITNVIFALKMDKNHELSERRLKELLGNHFIGGGKKRITIEIIQSAVEDFYGVAHKDLVGKKKERRIVHPRQVAIYLCRELSESTLKNIGNAFNRDHTTVMHSCDLINNQLQEDRNLREELEAVREKIRIQQY